MPHNKRTQPNSAQLPEKRRPSRRQAASSGDEEQINLKKLQVDIQQGWKGIQKNRYKTIGKAHYKSDRWLWNGALLSILFWLWFIANAYHYNLDYFKCGDSPIYSWVKQEPCKNPFYKPYNVWKNQEILPPGEYGQKPGVLFNSAGPVTFCVLVIAGILNHIIHNRRWRSRR